MTASRPRRASPSSSSEARPNKRAELLDGAERDFELEGFRGLSVERLLRASRISTRTFYKHFESKDDLVVEVLERRHARYLDQVEIALAETESPVAALFGSLRRWIDAHGAKGCLYLRALGEYGDTNPAVAACAVRHKRALEASVARCVTASLGRPDPAASQQVWLIYEGATALAGVAGIDIVARASDAADTVLDAARAGTPG